MYVKYFKPQLTSLCMYVHEYVCMHMYVCMYVLHECVYECMNVCNSCLITSTMPVCMYVCMYVGWSGKEGSAYRLQRQVLSILPDAAERVDKGEWLQRHPDLEERGAAAGHRVFQVRFQKNCMYVCMYVCMYICCGWYTVLHT